MFFIVIGAIIGAALGGPMGALFGGALGHVARVALQGSIIGSLRVAQSELIEITFAVMGAVCKADNVVTPDEIKVVEQTFDMLNLHGEQREQAKAAFRQGKQPDFNLDEAVDQFARLSRRRRPLVQLFLQLQCMAIAADGRVDPAEHAMLVRVARRLGLHEADVSQLEALLRAAGAGPTGAGAAPQKDRLADAYQALGVTPESSATEIKRAYRKLISQAHPDKLASRGLPESMRAVAEERSREINSAYDMIKAARSDVK
jgi:DnaJ like chaperone protein